MACQYEEKLTSWLLNDLSPQEQDEVSCHVVVCDACQKSCDDLRRVLFPLRSALYKDQGLFREHRPLSWTQRVMASPWLRQAAILLISCTIVCAVMTLYYYQLTQRHVVEGPVMHITFGKKEEPPPPLEPVVMPSTPKTDLLAQWNVVAELGLADIEDVPLPLLPGSLYLPQFVTLDQLALWQAYDKRPEAVHDRLMRELPDAQPGPDTGPIRRPRKTRPSHPVYGPTMLASPRYKAATNQPPSTGDGRRNSEQ
jgi:hypothetical protein